MKRIVVKFQFGYQRKEKMALTKDPGRRSGKDDVAEEDVKGLGLEAENEGEPQGLSQDQGQGRGRGQKTGQVR